VRADLDEQSAAILFIGMIQGLVVQITIFGAQRSCLKKRAGFSHLSGRNH